VQLDLLSELGQHASYQIQLRWGHLQRKWRMLGIEREMGGMRMRSSDHDHWAFRSVDGADLEAIYASGIGLR